LNVVLYLRDFHTILIRNDSEWDCDLGCAFRRNSGGFRPNLAKRHRPEQNVTGIGTGMCYYYLRHSGPFRLVLVYKVPTGRKWA
jgi:hypothetical protein